MSLPLPAPKRRPKKRTSKMPNFRIRDRNGPPPIFRLNEDLLLHIFDLNTLTDTDLIERFYHKPEFSLVSARHASQVCTSWRSLTLASSSLWANTINLKHLDQKDDNWRREILKRTRDSPISVVGDLYEGRPATEFFLSLLGDHWTRLRRIYISSQDNAIAEDERWLSTQSPAPNLEIFHIHFPSRPAFSTADDTLFSNTAPSIHTLITGCINFKLSGRWLSHIRHLHLNDCSVSQTILFALAEMMALENVHMDIDITDIGTEDRFWPTIILPKLKRICLYAKLRTLIVLMGHIAPTSGCTSEYESVDNAIFNLSIEDISLLRRGFSSHFQSFSDFRRNETISWVMTKDLFALTNELKEGGNPEFFLHIEIDLGSEWHVIPDIILDSLYSCDLSSIKTLELDISNATLDPFNLHVARFYRSLLSLETLYTDSQTMELLLQTQEHLNGAILFPRLQTIVFDTDAELKSDVIMRFLLWRRDADVPITNFDLYNCTSPNQERLLFLEGIDGLDVEWNEEIRDGM
jgi:hypothetical protein